MSECELCTGDCVGADLVPLLDPNLHWLWDQIAAAADRRGSLAMTEGALTVKAPADAAQRSAAVGLLGGRRLDANQSRRVDLKLLTARLRRRGARLTPGAVAAHAVGRQLAVRARSRAARAEAEERLSRLASQLLSTLDGTCAVRPDPEAVLPGLRRAGWIARLLADQDPERLLRDAVAVIAGLPSPGYRMDRRLLADKAARRPHALDEGTRLGGLVLAMLATAGVVPPGRKPRAAWHAVGVDCDDLTGGLTAIGIHPTGWHLPAGAAVTVPPRELAACTWEQSPVGGGWVFVTENPSVATAAADLCGEGVDVRLLCTSGTPSAREVEAVGRLALAGWSVAVRADFDGAGLSHVSALLAAMSGGRSWRMGVEDYLASLAEDCDESDLLDPAGVPDTWWEPDLAPAMRRIGRVANEERLLPALLDDLRRGRPAIKPGSER